MLFQKLRPGIDWLIYPNFWKLTAVVKITFLFKSRFPNHKITLNSFALSWEVKERVLGFSRRWSFELVMSIMFSSVYHVLCERGFSCSPINEILLVLAPLRTEHTENIFSRTLKTSKKNYSIIEKNVNERLTRQVRKKQIARQVICLKPLKNMNDRKNNKKWQLYQISEFRSLKKLSRYRFFAVQCEKGEQSGSELVKRAAMRIRTGWWEGERRPEESWLPCSLRGRVSVIVPEKNWL